MRFLILLSLFFLSQRSVAQTHARISTLDIDHFWEAYDSLATARDSVDVFQRLYIYRATPGFKEFILARNFAADEYVALIKRFPKFWASIRPNTERIAVRKNELEDVFKKFQKILPEFKAPDICFAIGCLRTGGTTRYDLIMIGSEIASADSTTNISEFKGWLSHVLRSSSDITAMVAHEAVHTQQKNNHGYRVGYQNHRVLTQSIREGCADFICSLLIGSIFNKTQYQYGLVHEAELWREFQQNINSEDLSDWLYNGNKSVNRPADLGYFIGYRICERYYHQSKNKVKAIRELLTIKDYKKFLEKSGYAGY